MPVLASVFVYSVAGLCLFLMLLNRFLILRPDSRLKSPLLLLAFFLLVGGTACLGWTYPYRPWVLLPITVLGLVALGEVRRAVIRRLAAGSPCVEATPYRLYLTRPITTTDLVCRRFELPCSKWKGPDLRIAHLTDLHVNPRIPSDFYEQVFSVVEECRPDLVFVTGDFISKPASLPTLRQLLRPLGRHGTFGVLGNHDYWVDADGVRSAVIASGITLLPDGSVTLCLAGQSVRISGLDYPWDRSRRSIPASKPDELRFVLSHTPDNIYRISRNGADCVFSGHYHAGQLRMPLVGSVVVPSVYGRRFDHGHFVVGGTHLFVAGGIGAANPPFRVYCPPDVFIVDIKPEPRPQSAATRSA